MAQPTKEQMLDESAANKQSTYDEWMKKPETQLLISLLPPGDNDVQRDCLTGLLKAAISVGYDSGAGAISLLLLKGIMENMREGR